MGALGRLGSAARGIRFRVSTGAQAIIQLGMAFGIDTAAQQIGDVLVSSSLIPYDNREIRPEPDSPAGYVTNYDQAGRQPARSELVELFLREIRRGGHQFGLHVGAILSGAARIRSTRFRDELVAGVPRGDDPIVGGEMEGVGLLAAATSANDSVWCVVKGISDFADRQVTQEGRISACRNSAEFVLNALENDAARPRIDSGGK